ncbi:DNA helicase RecQ [Marinigracilibium pacificum]|uniref:DNA helicase RecQ n=1 Tax=Marinigracilibium pacificum TaxID=2729599 RepID=A0A848J3B6_9BACT|nr:DNA helicase RecQ [Marinigracilibium pacificum]NMM48839.1 DNA helicase RecQ [Marinigracilibium pacificum]
MSEVNTDLLRTTLKDVFGYHHFRGNQENIINNIIDGNDTFVIMPTGAGKSLCYQLPAVILEGTTIVISPLIALMKNQVDSLRALGLSAYFLNSSLSKSEINKVKKETLAGNTKLLYVAPESLTKEDNIEFLKKINISLVAIDEAHCISEWGHDFRPEYRRIKSIIGDLGSMPVVALTATATPKVQLDIQRNLQMEDATVFKSSFNRHNLYYEVRPKQNIKKQIIQFLKPRKGQSGIVYCLSRKKVEEIAQFLAVNGFRAAPYHAGLDSNVRMNNQDGFLNEDIDIIVATIAFGMGIDKPDVRFVIHYDTPKSIEGYYQETGRAGRDGLDGHCLMFYSYNDILKLEKFNKDKSVTERENGKVLLEEVSAYAESAVCRRKQLLHYFGESWNEEECQSTAGCDACNNPQESFEGKEHLTAALKAVVETDQRFGIGHLVDVIRGSENQYVISYGHDKTSIYGFGKGESKDLWSSILRQALLFEYLEKDIENIGILKISEKGKQFIESPHSIELRKPHDYSELTKDTEEEMDEPAAPSRGHDEALFQILKDLRKKIAKQKDLPPYVIFQDNSLEEMATSYPTDKDQLTKVNGVGTGKVAKFGKPFLDAINKYVEDNDIIKPDDILIKSSGDKSKHKINIIQQIDRKTDLEEMAESLGISFEALLDEIENIVYSGTKLNLDYYIENFLDEDAEQELFDYFMEAESDSLEDALDEFEEEEYSEEEIRLIRIKFLSEIAN